MNVNLISGGILGAGLGYNYSRGRFKSVPQILVEDATLEQKDRLANAILSLLNEMNIVGIAQLSQALQTNRALVQTVIVTVRKFFEVSMNYYVEN